MTFEQMDGLKNMINSVVEVLNRCSEKLDLIAEALPKTETKTEVDVSWEGYHPVEEKKKRKKKNED